MQQFTFIFNAAIINEVIGCLLYDPNIECPACLAPDHEGAAPKKSDVSFGVDGTATDEEATPC
jgi:hypothetical protein